MKTYRYFLLLLTGLFISCQNGNEINLVKNSNSDYQIIIPSEADTLVVKAAGELQKYIEVIGNVRLPVISEDKAGSSKAIWVGNTGMMKTKKINSNQIIYFLNSDQLVISGGNSESTLNAVYTFLENELGCRFYSPNLEVIPHTKRISISNSLNYSYEPEITTRTISSSLFYNNNEFACKLKVSSKVFPYYVPTAEVHTFNRFVQPEKFFKAHPEYYALRDGIRKSSQLCLTNEAVFRIVRDSVASLFQRYPDARVISVGQNDNSQYCQCDNCMAINNKEGSPAGSLIAFVNRIASDFPSKMISTLAYQYTRKTPINLKPAPNVMIVLCSIECDRSAPIAEKSKDFAADLVEWNKITSNLMIWDYTTQFTNFLGPFPNLYILKPNILFFRDNKVKWIFEQHSGAPSELFELRSYLTAKLLWDPGIDVDSTIKDFLNGYYEEAGPYIWKYISTIHDELKKDSGFSLSIYGDPSQAFSSYLKPELLSRYCTWYDEAEKSVSGKPQVLKRVKVARLSVDYAALEAARANLSKDFSMVILQGDSLKKVPERLKRLLEDFRNTCAEANIISMNETGYSVEDYVDSYNITLERAQKHNLATGKKVWLKEPATKYAHEDPQTLTDGAFGGGIFYSNWLGFEGKNMEATIDLEQATEVKEISTTFLRVPVRYLPKNHIIFFPLSVQYLYSVDGINFISLKKLNDEKPLPKTGKSEIQTFTSSFPPVKTRYIKIIGENICKAPAWHRGAGQPVWIFADEVEVR